MSSLLGAVETLLYEALCGVIDPERVSISGPSEVPPSGVFPRVTVAATECVIEDSPFVDRRSIRTSIAVMWPTARDVRVFPIPKRGHGELSELLVSTGHLLRAGDDFVVEDGAIKLRRPLPEGASSLQGHFAGEPAEGYSERTQARVCAQLRVWSESRETLDSLSAQVTASIALLAASRRCIRTATDTGERRFEQILRDALPRRHATRRREFNAPAPQLLCDHTELELRGELESRVLVGPAIPKTTIRAVRVNS